MTSISPETINKLETIGIEVAEESPAILSVLGRIPGMSVFSTVAQVLPMLLTALHVTGGDAQAVADHLDPTKPADPRLSGG